MIGTPSKSLNVRRLTATHTAGTQAGILYRLQSEDIPVLLEEPLHRHQASLITASGGFTRFGLQHLRFLMFCWPPYKKIPLQLLHEVVEAIHLSCLSGIVRLQAALLNGNEA